MEHRTIALMYISAALTASLALIYSITQGFPHFALTALTVATICTVTAGAHWRDSL